MSGRYAKESFDRERYERELAATREVLAGPVVSAPVTALELAEPERLVSRYPEHARRIVTALPPPT